MNKLDFLSKKCTIKMCESPLYPTFNTLTFKSHKWSMQTWQFRWRDDPIGSLWCNNLEKNKAFLKQKLKGMVGEVSVRKDCVLFHSHHNTVNEFIITLLALCTSFTSAWRAAIRVTHTHLGLKHGLTSTCWAQLASSLWFVLMNLACVVSGTHIDKGV